MYKITDVGAFPLDDEFTCFRVWAPQVQEVELLLKKSSQDSLQSYPMTKESRGYFSLTLKEISPGTQYKYRLDKNREIPDPASRYQPDGPLGYSEVVCVDFQWSDQSWKNPPLNEYIIYELHVGTFTPSSSFEGVIEKLPHLKKLGVTAIEVMPIAQFSGKRNWGYDGVGLFAPQNSYGQKSKSPQAFKQLVNECHQQGIAVILDVVYNHLGPEGNFLPLLGPYFHDRYKNPWGESLNFDGEHSDEVKNFFLANAQYWFQEFHVDALRLDAVHAIMDNSAKPFLEELAESTRKLQQDLSKKLYLIAESEANDSRIIKPPDTGGLGLDAHWADDFHHVLHTLVTKEKQSYYQDFGEPSQLAEVFREGLIYQGQYSPAKARRHGRSYQDIARHRLVICSQNHDQIGNRKDGERLNVLAGDEAQKWASSCVFLSGALPLVFMGEEFGEKRPFLFFVDHTDSKLNEQVRKGRKKEFERFAWKEEPPDPVSLETFQSSILNWPDSFSTRGEDFFRHYQKLIEISKWIRAEKFYESGPIKAKLQNEECALAVLLENKNFVVEISISCIPESQKFSRTALAVETSHSPEIFFTSGNRADWTREEVHMGPFAVIAVRWPKN